MSDRLNNGNVQSGSAIPGQTRWIGKSVAIFVIVVVAVMAYHMRSTSPAQAAARPPAAVEVSAPLRHDIRSRLGFLGQFSAVNRVEIRPQVGGTLVSISFKDGDVVHKGDVLFEIDQEPYQIKLNEATAALESSNARLALAIQELARAQELQRSGAGTVENVDQKVAEQRAAQAAVDNAHALVHDAKFDLGRCRITAPFTGRIGTHLVSVGNLVSGSRAANGPTTLLATLVSLDPVYLDFDMSENDYVTFQRTRQNDKGPLADVVNISPTGDAGYTRQGTLDFIDNSLDRSSGTIHARATISNKDLSLMPGGFARIRLETSAPQSALFVPDAAVFADQTDHIVYVLDKNDIATVRKVDVGDIREGLRVIRSGLSPTDEVIVGGITSVRPGSKVSPHPGSIQFVPNQDEGGAKS